MTAFIVGVSHDNLNNKTIFHIADDEKGKPTKHIMVDGHYPDMASRLEAARKIIGDVQHRIVRRETWRSR